MVTELESNMESVKVELMGKAHHRDAPAPRKHTVRELNSNLNLSYILERSPKLLRCRNAKISIQVTLILP